jgi:dephospho-CoA kinase
LRVPLVALTGGIATGKTHCLNRFEGLGAKTISADRLARDVVAPGTPGLAAVVERFGPDMVRGDGSLDRARLASVVFVDPDARRDLEAIVHPAVYAAIRTWADRELPAGRVLIADVPLLYETGREQEFDAVIVAACRPDQQLQRVVARDGLTELEAKQRIASQLPIEEKARRADYVIDTSGSFEDTEKAILRVWNALRAR